MGKKKLMMIMIGQTLFSAWRFLRGNRLRLRPKKQKNERSSKRKTPLNDEKNNDNNRAREILNGTHLNTEYHTNTLPTSTSDSSPTTHSYTPLSRSKLGSP
jgi:hypothetical protein